MRSWDRIAGADDQVDAVCSLGVLLGANIRVSTTDWFLAGREWKLSLILIIDNSLIPY